jgi:hypothetical protein
MIEMYILNRFLCGMKQENTIHYGLIYHSYLLSKILITIFVFKL